MSEPPPTQGPEVADDAPPGSPASTPAARPEEAAPRTTEDFLYHLYRGSEMLMQDRVVEAKDDLERALALQPEDAKGQDLLAGVYFRLGLYPPAIDIWRQLVDRHPRDPTLRVNLALAMLKTGQPETALAHIEAAVDLRPGHDRAWGYLGLIKWRLGRFDEAREAFLRGGQASMAQRMDRVSESSVGTVAAPEMMEAGDDLDLGAMRRAAEDALSRIEASDLSLSLEAASLGDGGGRWDAREPGAERLPRRARPLRPQLIAAPPPLSDVLDSWAVSLPDDRAFAVTESGALLIQSADDVYARARGLTALQGDGNGLPVHCRARGRDREELLGDDEPILQWRGPMAAVVAPPERQAFLALSLVDDTLYVRESLVHAFDRRLGFESGRLPLSGAPVRLLQLYGSGVVVLCLERRPAALKVADSEPVSVAAGSLVGWTGRLLPSTFVRTDQAAPTKNGLGLTLRGDGIVLVA